MALPGAIEIALESKQTAGKKMNYRGPCDGEIGLPVDRFPEAPYGYLTWNNNDDGPGCLALTARRSGNSLVPPD